MTTSRSLYECPAYLRAAADGLGAQVELVRTSGATLPLLTCPDGVLRTVPGLPRPYGTYPSAALSEMALALTDPQISISATLSPLRGGPELARELAVRGAELVGERQICVVGLTVGTVGSPLSEIARGLADAQAAGVAVRVSSLDDAFVALSRCLAEGTSIAEVSIADEYHLEALAELDNYVVTVSEGDQVVAAALFLHDARESYCHMAATRRPAVAELDAAWLVLAAGIEQARRAGCELVVLGGGLTDRRDDPLLDVKRALATASLPRFAVTTRRFT